MTCHRLYQSSALEITSCVGEASQRKPAAMHFQSFEVHFQDDGAYVLHDERRSVLVDAHHVELRRPGTTLTYSRPAVSADRGTSIRFSSAVAASLLPLSESDTPASFPSGIVPLDSRGFRQLRALRRSIHETTYDDGAFVERRAHALLEHVVRVARHGPRAARSARPATSARRMEALERAKAFLTEHVRERPTLADTASVADYAPHHFARLFRHETGLAVHEYLNELRLRQAAVRLDDGVANLSSLALDLGFASQSHFTTAFRQRFGCTPGVYRAR